MRGRAELIGVVLAVAMAAAAPARAGDPAYAIVIGHNAPPRQGPGSELSPLRYADDDAVRYHQLLSRFASTRLLAVLDERTQRRYPGMAAHTQRPTLSNLRRAVAEIAVEMRADRARGERPVFYLAFSGHGARSESGEVFLALDGAQLTEAILFDDVLAPVPSAYSHVLIDACHAGGVVGARGFFDVEIDARTERVDSEQASVVSRRIDEFPHVGYIAATTAGQKAHEWSEVEAGVFTHALLSGLLGPADVNGDRRVEYSEAQAFAASAVRGLPDPRAVPEVIAAPPRADRNAPIVALDELAGTRLLAGDLGSLGHFHVELENGQRYADAHLAAGHGGAIAIPRRSRAFVRTRSGQAAVAAGGAAVRVGDLELRDRWDSARGSLDASYRAGLFSSSYGEGYYRGFVDSIGAVGVAFGPSRPELVDAPAPGGGNRAAAWAAASVSGASAIAAIAGGVFAYRAKREFDATDLQRPAYEAKVRYERSLLVSAGAGVAAAAGAAVAWWLWPDREPAARPAISTRGDVGLSFRVSW